MRFATDRRHDSAVLPAVLHDVVMVEFDGLMTRERLQGFLDQRGFDTDSYRLHGGHASEAYVMDHRGVQWVVFYAERGIESGVKTFATEDLACRHLADLLWRDRATRITNQP